MNRLFTILCMASLLVFHTSCSGSVMGLESPSVEIKTRTVDQRVQNLIQQARQGDVEAYNSLALCYRDGDGVDKSWLNMLCMYAIYSQKTGEDIENLVEFFDEGLPFRLLFEIVNMPCSNEDAEAKMAKLRQTAPAEAKAIEAARQAFSKEEATTAMSILREAEKEGSEFAVISQAIYYDEAKDKTGQEEFLTRIAEKYPLFNLMLGESYARKYGETEDFSYIQKAIECYYKADAYGMLIPKYATALLGMYDYFGQKGLLKYDEQEVERLKVLAKRTY
ncbi:MAG: hypothetical protein J6V00_05065 [Bacteroidaceae bacterium]|nr:hypothetical protein [Bacteroidaceae bacterium]